MGNRSTGSAILGTLLAVGVGFAAGILLAPASGKETRKNIGDKADDWKKDLEDATNKTLASLKETKESVEKYASKEYDRLKKVATDMAHKYNGKVDEYADETKDSIDEYSHEVKVNA